MHPALEIDEILFNIFGHCFPHGMWESTVDLAALARTCRTFKDPALDILWEDLEDMSPLARCLPEASHKAGDSPEDECYSFDRPLTPNEWVILRSYTRRIRTISTLYGLNRKSLKRLWNAPARELLFPSLRHLYFEYTHRAVGIFNMPFPLLTYLDVELHTLRSFEKSIKSFAKTSQNLRKLHIHMDLPVGFNMNHVDPSFISQLRNLEDVQCGDICLDIHTLVHLSRIPSLALLHFRLRSTLLDQLSPVDSPLTFPNLHYFCLQSDSLDSVSRLLPRTHLPAMTDFAAYMERCPSRLDLFSFMAAIHSSGVGHTIHRLALYQVYEYDRAYVPGDESVLRFEHLKPCRAFTNLRDLTLTIEWKVDLTDSELLTLASAWPDLKALRINSSHWGWNTLGGITPNGLVQLLRTCPSLHMVALAIDTRGDIDIPSSPPSFRSAKGVMLYMNVLDSFIEADAVPNIAAFFVALARSCQLLLSAWKGEEMQKSPHYGVCNMLWEDVRQRIKDERAKWTIVSESLRN